MNTEDFQFFIRVADLGSISKAAKAENISVSVASQKIQRLEHNLQLRLLHRTTRRLSLTDEGRTLLEHGRIWIDDFLNLHQQLKKPVLSGTLRITTSATFGEKVLTPIIAQFSLLHPELKIYLDLSDQNLDLIQHSIDLAIRIGKLKNSSLIAKSLSPNQRLLCAAPAYLQKYGIPKNLSELAAHRCILQQHEHGLIDTWNFIDQHGKMQQLNVSGYFISNSGEGIRQASLSGLGISNHSIWHVADDLKSGKLVQVLPDHQVEPTTIYAVFPHRKFIPPKTHLFLEYLLGYFQQHYLWYKN